MNKTDYIKKCKALLDNEKSYQRLNAEPTIRFSNQLVSIKDLKDRHVNYDQPHRAIYPTSDKPQWLYCYSKDKSLASPRDC